MNKEQLGGHHKMMTTWTWRMRSLPGGQSPDAPAWDPEKMELRPMVFIFAPTWGIYFFYEGLHKFKG